MYYVKQYSEGVEVFSRGCYSNDYLHKLQLNWDTILDVVADQRPMSN